MQKQVKGLDYKGQDIFIGIDVHLKSWKVTVMMEKLYKKTFSQSPCPEELYKHLTSNYPGANYYSAYEAGFSGYWTHYKLLELGVNSIVVNAADVPTTGKEKVQKDDVRDCNKIARSLKNGELVPVYVPSKHVLDDRTALRYRKSLVSDRTRIKNRIKSFLHFNGIKIPYQLGNKLTKKFIEWLQSLELSSTSRLTLDGYLASHHEINQRVLHITKEIRKLANSAAYKENFDLLITVPGIGLITAMTLLTEMETMDRFESVDKLCSFVGLVPSTNSSGESERVGDITPRGHSVLRSAIIESAWVSARVDPVLARSYHQYCKRMKPNKAIVRIAKKLLSRIRHVLKNKQPYVCGVIK